MISVSYDNENLNFSHLGYDTLQSSVSVEFTLSVSTVKDGRSMFLQDIFNHVHGSHP